MTPTPSKPEASLRERIADQMALVRMMRGDAPADWSIAERLLAEAEAALAARQEAGAVGYGELPAKMAYDIDPDTGADRGSCCGHAYADGWNDCIEAVRRVPATPPASGEAGADLERAAVLLERYAEVIRRAPHTEIERYDYLPEVEDMAALIRRLAALVPAGMEQCEWSQCDDEGSDWDTRCGHLFMLNDGSPSENSMSHCCFCGKLITERRWQPDDDEAAAPQENDHAG